MRVDTYDGLDARVDTTWFLTAASVVVATLVAIDGDETVGCGIVTGGRIGWSFEYKGEARDQLLEAARSFVAAKGGTEWSLWLSAPNAEDDAAAARIGLRVNRELFQLRVPLPRLEPVTITTRSFVVGQDNDAWLALNNRAFAWHPDQSDWTNADLEKRFAEPWFDADGFLVHERDGRMIGFCWTKVHEEYDPPLGEIYVIAKDADTDTPGLGKQLTLAGLDHLANRGIQEGMLYVDATNTKALGMYDAMGFTKHHVDRNYVGVVAPTAAPTP